MFHWLFALSFLGAYLTADGERWRALHVTLGYTLAGLLAFRVLYGLLGPRHAGLDPMLRKLASAPAWLRSAAQGLKPGTAPSINWRQGQNLLMALAVTAMLLLVVPLTLSGYGTYNGQGGGRGGHGGNGGNAGTRTVVFEGKFAEMAGGIGGTGGNGGDSYRYFPNTFAFAAGSRGESPTYYFGGNGGRGAYIF
jgi:hypothetical protein